MLCVGANKKAFPRARKREMWMDLTIKPSRNCYVACLISAATSKCVISNIPLTWTTYINVQLLLGCFF